MRKGESRRTAEDLAYRRAATNKWRAKYARAIQVLVDQKTLEDLDYLFEVWGFQTNIEAIGACIRFTAKRTREGLKEIDA